VTLTSHGRVVARIVPASEEDEAKDRAWRQLLAELGKKPAVNVGRWTRDELYNEDRA